VRDSGQSTSAVGGRKGIKLTFIDSNFEQVIDWKFYFIFYQKLFRFSHAAIQFDWIYPLNEFLAKFFTLGSNPQIQFLPNVRLAETIL
jgi:hypothetical protein